MHKALLPPRSVLCAGPSRTADAPSVSNAQLLQCTTVQTAVAGAALTAACSAHVSRVAAVTPQQATTSDRKRSWEVCSSRALDGRHVQPADQMPPLKRSNTSCSGCSTASTTSAVNAGCTPDSACSSQSLVHEQQDQTLSVRCQQQLQEWQRDVPKERDSLPLMLQQHLEQHAKQQAWRVLQQQQQYQQQLQKQQQLQLQHYKRQQQHYQQQAAMMAAAAATHTASSVLCMDAAPAPKSQPQLLQTSLLAWAGSVLRAGCHSAYLLAQHIWARVQDSLDLMLLLSLGAHSPAHVAMLVCLWVASKLEDNRRNVMPSSKLAVATGMLPWGITSVELHIMDLLDWRPYKGWSGASCCVTDVS